MNNKQPSVFGVYWEYEDELPDVPQEDYDRMYELSEVIDGVRMFPFVYLDVPGFDIKRPLKVYL